MAEYPPPILHNGQLNSLFNPDEFQHKDINIIHELKQENKELKQSVNELKNQINKLTEIINKLEKIIHKSNDTIIQW